MQVQIQFLAGGANSMIGGFCAGDVARVSAEMAKHLVEEVGIAKVAVLADPAPAQAKPVVKKAAKK